MTDHPLISAMMIIKYPSIEHLHRTIEGFLDQTYPNKELIIINNPRSQFEASSVTIPKYDNVHLYDTPSQFTAGQCRNYGISKTNGQILAQYDLDSWHHKNRLEYQVSSLVENSAHMSILTRTLLFSGINGRLSYYSNNKNLMLNSMVFIRPANIDYPDVEKQEELGLLNKFRIAKYNIISIDKPDMVCKLYHGNIKEIKTCCTYKKHAKAVSKMLKNIDRL